MVSEISTLGLMVAYSLVKYYFTENNLK